MVGLAQNLSFILLGEDRSASKTMDGAAAKAEQATGRIGSAFTKVGGIIGGEFGNILSEVGAKTDEMGGHAAQLSRGLEIGGGIATGAGLALLQFGSRGQQASDQLKAAMTAAGDASSDYSEEIEKMVKKQEDFDHSAVDTKSAITVLTEATGSTKKALEEMNVVTELAAAKHISLSDSASLVAKVLGGSGGRVLKQYGITMETVKDPTIAVAAAQKQVQDSTDQLSAAQKRLSDLQEIDAGKKKLSTAESIALRNAQDKVTESSGKLSEAQKKLQDAQSNTKTQTQASQEALDQLSKKLDGQDKAAVSNFGSQVDIIKTKIGDWAEEVSGPLGTAMTIIGPLVTGVGVVIDIVRAKHEAAALAALTQAAATDAAAVATEGEATAMVGLDAAMDANPIGVVVGALGLLAGVAGGIALTSTMNFTKGQEALKGALDATNGAIDQNVEKTTAKALADNGALRAASELGINTHTLVEATLGNVDAQNQVAAAMSSARERANDLLMAHTATAAEAQENSKQAVAMGHALDTLGTAYQNLSGTAQGEVQNLKDEQYALTGIKGAAQGAAAAIDVLNGKHVHVVVDPTNISTTHITSDIPKHAGGGDIHDGGYTLVGEQGPEIVSLPAGSRVWPSGSAPSGGGSGAGVTIAFSGPVYAEKSSLGKVVTDALIQFARTGGSVSELKRAMGLPA